MDLTASASSITPAEQRLLDALTKPMARQELASKLRVTRQRIRQLETRLLAKELIKASNNSGSRRVLIKEDDPTILIDSLQARIISVLRTYENTLASSISAALRVEDEKLLVSLLYLEETGLIIKTDHFGGRVAWTLTTQGRHHPQRRETARKASLVPSGVRSERSINVLSLLAREGPTRGRDISARLGLDKTSVNAFMQYLKRKGWIRKVGDNLMDPYELTATGLQVVDGLSRQTREV